MLNRVRVRLCTPREAKPSEAKTQHTIQECTVTLHGLCKHNVLMTVRHRYVLTPVSECNKPGYHLVSPAAAP